MIRLIQPDWFLGYNTNTRHEAMFHILNVLSIEGSFMRDTVDVVLLDGSTVLNVRDDEKVRLLQKIGAPDPLE